MYGAQSHGRFGCSFSHYPFVASAIPRQASRCAFEARLDTYVRIEITGNVATNNGMVHLHRLAVDFLRLSGLPLGINGVGLDTWNHEMETFMRVPTLDLDSAGTV